MLNTLKKLFHHPKRLNLTVLFIQYDRGENGGSDQVFATLQSYLANIRGAQITYLRIDNKDEQKPFQQISSNMYIVEGDNRYHEFSGWQKGFEAAMELRQKPDLILFVNDMFLAPGESFLKDYASLDLLERSLANNSVIGRIDSTSQRYSAYKYEIAAWVCTNCFLVPRKAVEAIGNLVSVGENLDDFLPPSCPPGLTEHSKPTGNSVFRSDAPMNETYKNWMVEWLTERWHSKLQITPETWGLFRTKVRNILNESVLTARFAEAGFHPEKYGDKMYY